MTVEDLKKYKEKLSKLSEKEKELRNIYLRKIAQGEISGPLTGYPSVDKPWYRYYDDLSINASLPKMTAYEFMYSRNKDNQNDVAINYFGNKIKYKKAVLSDILVNGSIKNNIFNFEMMLLHISINYKHPIYNYLYTISKNKKSYKKGL